MLSVIVWWTWATRSLGRIIDVALEKKSEPIKNLIPNEDHLLKQNASEALAPQSAT